MIAGRWRPFEDLMQVWQPSTRLPLADWAEKYFHLSPEYSATTGLIELEPWQRSLMNAYTDPQVYMLVVMAAVQMVKTLLLQISSAYEICEDPGPILFVGYKDDDAIKFSKERFGPMARDIDPLHARISPAKSRDPNNTIEHKRFPGGTIEFVGSLAPANLGRRTVRYLKFDEVDQYEASSGKQGHAVDLGIRRTIRYGSRRKIVVCSSPTIRGESKIGELFEGSDQRRGFVGCHHCGHEQILLWNQVLFDSKLSIAEASASARYCCVRCGELWTDSERRRNIRQAFTWRATSTEPFNGVAGFCISHLYSVLPLHSLALLTREWLESKNDRQRRKVFINTNLCELWEEEGERPDHEKVKERAEPFYIGRNRKLPEEVVFLMAGVDVQAKRLEVQVLGFGNDASGNVHTWTVDYVVIELFDGGNARMTSAEEYWDVWLKGLLEGSYAHPSGAELPIIAMAIDVGHNPEPVYRFAKKFPQPLWGPKGLEITSPRTVLCVRGLDSEHLNAIARVSEREAARTRQGPGKDLPIITLGTGFLKTELYSELLGRADLRRVHISAELSVDYFRGLVAEKRVVDSKGVVKWERIFPRNEPLDTWDYARGAFYCFKADRFGPAEWRVLRRRMKLPPAPWEKDPEKPKVPRPSTIDSPYL